MNIKRRTFSLYTSIVVILALFAIVFFGLVADNACTTSDGGAKSDSNLIDIIDANLLPETKHIVRIRTYRNAELNEDEVLKNLEEIHKYLIERAEEFNANQKTLELRPFEWKKKVDGEEYWVFGFRLGEGNRKLALITHLDTVPPGENVIWKPFEPRLEKREYLGKETDFLVGRGALDDKGPAITAFNVIKAVAREFDGTTALDGLTLELVFDTSEETDMSTPHYLQDSNVVKPYLGIVFDAMWTIRAEKGIERPVFTIPRTSIDNKGLWVEKFSTSEGSSNQIPDLATAVIMGDPALLKQFRKDIEQRYKEYGFDDISYRKAELSVVLNDSSDSLQLITKVSGAQHGSAPQENRDNGANPLVSLANFIAHLVETGDLANNEIGRMTQFMAWAWGTRCLGENHPDLLMRNDEIFKDGTTYALTKFVTDNEEIKLEIDIRYAIPHHGQNWDRKTWGIMEGDSQFKQIFDALVSQFNREYPGPELKVATRTIVGPDIKNYDSPQFVKIREAYKEIIGQDTPLLAIGGGTDSKGHPELIAAGALFTDSLGPPVNYHGINEGVPLEDLRNSAKILYKLSVEEVSNAR